MKQVAPHLVRAAIGDARRPSIAWWVMAVLGLAVGGYAMALFDARAVKDAVPGFPWLDEVHFAAGGVALAVGPWLFRRDFLARRTALHHALGKLYFVAVAGSGLAALAMGPFAMAGTSARLGFTSLAVLWLGSTAIGAWRIHDGRVVEHRRAMVVSYALCFAAATLRVQLPIWIASTGSFDAAYRIVAWSCWVPNLLFAWWWLSRTDLAGQPRRAAVTANG